MPVLGRKFYLVPGVLNTGLWCPKCLLPSGYEVNVYAFPATGVAQPRLLGTLRKCYDCDEPLPE